EFAIGNQGCVGLAQLALGTKKRPHLEEGTRCFEFDKFPTFGELIRLQTMIGPELKCKEGQVPRMFLLQFWTYYTEEEAKGLKVSLERTKLKGWDRVTEIDPRSINTTYKPPEHPEWAPFDFIVVYRFEGHPGSEFFLHMNKGRVFDKKGAVVERSTLNE